MAVYCEFISLIIRRDSIDKYFVGGWKRFVIELPNRSMATDGEVVRVGFMNPVDTNIYLEFLKGEGLQFRQSGDREIDDISDLDQFMGHRYERQWLEFGDRVFNERTYFCCWKKGSSIDTIAKPSYAGSMMRHVSPEIFNERFSYLRSENGLEIYSDTKYNTRRENYLPEGMSIEEHYEYYLVWRKERENKRIKKNEKLVEAIDKELIEKQKAQELIEAEERKAFEKRLEEEMLIQRKKDQEFRQVQEKKAEDKLYAKVAKIIKKKTVNKDNPAKVLETLVELAFKTNDQIYLDLIDEFWQFNYGLMFNLMDDGDSFYLTVDPKEIIEQLKSQPEDYFEDESEMSDDDKFNTFKGMIESRFESDDSCEIVKPVGKFVLTAYLSDSRENKPLSNFNVWSNSKQVDDYFMNSALFCSEYGGKCNYDDQKMRAYFDNHYLNNFNIN